VTHLDVLARPDDAARAREKLGVALTEGGCFDAALEVLDVAAATFGAAGDLAAWSRVSAQLGELHQLQGTVAAGLTRLQPILATLEEQGAWPGVAALSVIVAHLLGQAGRYDEQFVLAQRAVDLARRVGDDRLLAYALRRCGYPLYLAGQAAAALAVLEEALQLAEGRGDPMTLSWVLALAGEIYGDQGDVDRQRRSVERALAYAEQLDHPQLLLNSLMARGALAFHQGAWMQARRDYERSLAVSRRMSRSRYPAWPLALLAQVSLAEGAWREAARYLAESLRAAEGGGGLWTLPFAQSVAAHGDLLAGRPHRARERLVPLLEGPDLAARTGFGSLPVRVLLAWTELDRGEVAAAAAMAALARQEAQIMHSLPALAEALWVEARVALRRQHWQAAERAVGEGLAIARRLRHPYREARLLRVSGELHRQRGEAAPARAQWEAALALFRRLGARPHAAHTVQDLAELRG
jgi:tetratricopeptide (TPR) repeat protein